MWTFSPFLISLLGIALTPLTLLPLGEIFASDTALLPGAGSFPKQVYGCNTNRSQVVLWTHRGHMVQFTQEKQYKSLFPLIYLAYKN